MESTPSVAPATPDVAAPSSSATQAQPTGFPERAEMLSALQRHRDNVAPAQGAPTNVDPAQSGPAEVPPEAADVTQEGQETAQPEAGKEQKGTDEESVPKKAFLERLKREKTKRESVEKDLHTFRAKASELDALLAIAVAENRELAQALEASKVVDPRDLQLREVQLRDQIRQAQEKARREAKEAYEKQVAEARQQEAYERFTSAIEEAVSSFPLTSFAEVKSEWGRILRSAREKGQTVDVNPKAIAKQLHERRMAEALRLAKAVAPQQQTQLPASVGASTGRASSFEYTPDREGLLRYLQASRARSQF